MTRVRIAPADRQARLDRVSEFEKQGHFTSEACALAGVPRAWLYKWRESSDRSLRGSGEDRRETSAADKEWIRRLLAEGKTQTEVSEEVQRCRATVRKIARELGLSMAPLRNGRRPSGTGEPMAPALLGAGTSPAAVDASSLGSAVVSSHTGAAGPNHCASHRDTEQLIGPAGMLQKKLTLEKGPFVFLFHGPPGVGKTALCEILARRLVERYEFESLSGRECTVEKMRELKISMGNAPMLTKWRVVVIEDLDRMPLAAQDSFREMLHKPPSYCAVFASTNLDRRGFEERLWTRFERFRVEGPSEKEIMALIAHLVPRKKAKEIVEGFPGNARDAIKEAEAWARLNVFREHQPGQSIVTEPSR